MNDQSLCCQVWTAPLLQSRILELLALLLIIIIIIIIIMFAVRSAVRSAGP